MSIVHGVDSNNKVVPLLLDASGNIIVSASQLTTTGGKIHVDANGNIYINHDEPSFQKPTAQHTNFSNLNLAAGTSSSIVLTVPSNERWILDYLSLQYVGTVAGVEIYGSLLISSVQYHFFSFGNLVSARIYGQSINAVLEAGYQVQTTIVGATLNDDIYVRAFCRRIK